MIARRAVDDTEKAFEEKAHVIDNEAVEDTEKAFDEKAGDVKAGDMIDQKACDEKAGDVKGAASELR